MSPPWIWIKKFNLPIRNRWLRAILPGCARSSTVRGVPTKAKICGPSDPDRPKGLWFLGTRDAPKENGNIYWIRNSRFFNKKSRRSKTSRKNSELKTSRFFNNNIKINFSKNKIKKIKSTKTFRISRTKTNDLMSPGTAGWLKSNPFISKH